MTELAGAGAEAAKAAAAWRCSTRQWQSLQRTIAALEGKLASAKRENINNKIKIANTNLKSAWGEFTRRQTIFCRLSCSDENDYAAIGQAGDKAKVGAAPRPTRTPPKGTASRSCSSSLAFASAA